MAEDRGPQLVAVVGLFLGLAWLFALLRAYVKLFLSKSWGADDSLLVVSLIFFSTYTSCSLSGVKYGTDRLIDNVPPEDIPRAIYFWWLCELFYTITTVFVRLSIAVFLLQFHTKPIQKYIIYGTLSMVITFSTSYLFLRIFQCHPVSDFWNDHRGIKGSCINPAVVSNSGIAQSVVSCTADWVLGLLPIALIWHFQLNFRTKVSIAGLVALGLLAGIAAAIRIIFIKDLAVIGDFFFATYNVAILSTVELGIGIVAVSGATLRPLFRSFYSLTTHGSGKSDSTYRSRLTTNHRNPKYWPSSRKYSNESTNTAGSIMLRNDVIYNRSFICGPPATYYESAENKTAVRDGDLGGIKVHKTVEISSVQDSDNISIASRPHTPWPISEDSNLV